MKVIKPYTEILDAIDGDAILSKIELCGRVCYKSEAKITDDSARKFVAARIKGGHEGVLECCSITVRFVCDRGVSHEIVRHRLASYCQESTRYCNYGNGDESVTFIEPCFWPEINATHEDTRENRRLLALRMAWETHMSECESVYLNLLHMGATPQEARSVLPNSLKTEVIMTANLREWKHFLQLRTAVAAHPQMRELTVPLLAEFKRLVPVVFDDIKVKME